LHLSVIARRDRDKQNVAKHSLLGKMMKSIKRFCQGRRVVLLPALAIPPVDWACWVAMSPRRAIIVGGGIGGLAAAIALVRAGWQADVFEQAAELREVGAGLTIWSNGVLALRHLGVESAALDVAAANHRTEVYSWRGQRLASMSLEELGRRLGTPSLTLLRGDLLALLARHIDPAAIHVNARLVDFLDDGARVTARFADGRQHAADILIGADGLHSIVRARRFGPEPLRYAGYTCWRGMAPVAATDLGIECGFESWGRGARFAVQPCGRERLFWYATQNAPPETSDSWQGRKRDVSRRFQHWHDPIGAVIQATDAANMLRNDIVDRPPRRGWSRGRVTLLGDAAHPTTPNFGQGACQAMEDAIVLASLLAQASDIPRALIQYERQRYRRTAWITRASWRLGRSLQRESLLANFLRDTATQSGLLRLPLEWQLRRMLTFPLPAAANG
jgi:2-polyprenyl-6-methoxyphenol hydroxylase-like FAD-dependent oxidoreductase